LRLQVRLASARPQAALKKPDCGGSSAARAEPPPALLSRQDASAAPRTGCGAARATSTARIRPPRPSRRRCRCRRPPSGPAGAAATRASAGRSPAPSRALSSPCGGLQPACANVPHGDSLTARQRERPACATLAHQAPCLINDILCHMLSGRSSWPRSMKSGADLRPRPGGAARRAPGRGALARAPARRRGWRPPPARRARPRSGASPACAAPGAPSRARPPPPPRAPAPRAPRSSRALPARRPPDVATGCIIKNSVALRVGGAGCHSGSHRSAPPLHPLSHPAPRAPSSLAAACTSDGAHKGHAWGGVVYLTVGCSMHWRGAAKL